MHGYGPDCQGEKNCVGNTTVTTLTDSQEIIRFVNMCLEPYLR